MVGEIYRTTAEGDLKAGDTVVVASGFWVDKLKRCRLEVVDFERNIRTGKAWVRMWGGKPGRQGWQYIRREHLKKV